MYTLRNVRELTKSLTIAQGTFITCDVYMSERRKRVKSVGRVREREEWGRRWSGTTEQKEGCRPSGPTSGTER